MAKHFVENNLGFDPKAFESRKKRSNNQKKETPSGFCRDAQLLANELSIPTHLAREILRQQSR